MSQNTNIPTGGTDRPMSKPVRFIHSGVIVRTFTFKERMKLAFGYPVVLEIHVACQHNPGEMKPLTTFHVLDESDPAKAQAKIKAMADSKRKAMGVEETKE